MAHREQKKPAILILTGASGAGKTALILALQGLNLPDLAAINCDRAPINQSESSDPELFQAALLDYWLNWVLRLEATPSVAVLDTQIRPHRALEQLAIAGFTNARIALVDCSAAVRNERLANRGQPELATSQMDCWAAYLRGQADALGLAIIDTSSSPTESLSALQKLIDSFVLGAV